MIDIMLTEEGELALKGNDIKTVTKDELRFQQAFCRVKSVVGDWYDEKKLGADLENMIGLPNNISTAKTGMGIILNAITENATFRINEIHIEYSLNKQTLEYRVYLRNLDSITSKLLIVSLDLVKGVNVRLGVD